MCDKIDFSEENPFEDLSYYREHTYVTFDGQGQTTTLDSVAAKDPTGELQVGVNMLRPTPCR